MQEITVVKSLQFLIQAVKITKRKFYHLYSNVTVKIISSIPTKQYCFLNSARRNIGFQQKYVLVVNKPNTSYRYIVR